MSALVPADLEDSTDERSREIHTLSCIYPELVLHTPFSFSISLPINPVSAVPTYFTSPNTRVADITVRGYLLSHFPPITLKFALPETYPVESPPEVEISTHLGWVWPEKIEELKRAIVELWREYGEVTWVTVDQVNQQAEQLFGLVKAFGVEYGIAEDKVLVLDEGLEESMVKWNVQCKKEVFEAGSYECGICLEPKPGTLCHKIHSCSHAFCRPCLTAYFTSAITRGEISSIVCSDPSCVSLAKKKFQQQHSAPQLTPPASPSSSPEPKPRKKFLPPTLPPEELEQIPLDKEIVERYIKLKHKESLDADPGTTYCPRPWCQAPSRESIKAHEDAMRKQHSTYFLPDLEVTPRIPPPHGRTEVEELVPEMGNESESDLQICSNSRCQLAFCRKCMMSWHGPLGRCRVVKDGVVVSEEELLTEEYLQQHTSPCPTCGAATIKSHGCNHMVCKCGTHFCFLCSAYLDPGYPYAHFNTSGLSCYQRLWEGETGDEEEIERRWGVGGIGYMRMMGMAVAVEEDEDV